MTTTTDETFQGWACHDCLFLLAYGETPEDWSDIGTADYLGWVANKTQGCDVVLGGPHDDDCANDGTQDCDCEHITFSWSSCDVCGSTLGGSRDAVTFWVREGA